MQGIRNYTIGISYFQHYISNVCVLLCVIPWSFQLYHVTKSRNKNKWSHDQQREVGTEREEKFYVLSEGL